MALSDSWGSLENVSQGGSGKCQSLGVAGQMSVSGNCLCQVVSKGWIKGVLNNTTISNLFERNLNTLVKSF